MTVEPSVVEQPPAEVTEPAPAETPIQKFIETLPEDLRGNPVFKNFQSHEDLARSYASAAKMVGLDKSKVLKLPNEDTPEAWNDIYNALGRPESPDKYDVSKYAENPVLDKEVLNGFLSKAHEAGVSQKAINNILEYYTQAQEQQIKAYEEKFNDQITQWQTSVKNEFGEAYQQKLSLAQKAIALGGDDMKAYVRDNWQAFEHPAVVKFLAKIGEMTSEDSGINATGDRANGAYTPSEAKMRLAEIESSQSWREIMAGKPHPMKESIMAEREKLFKYMYAGK